MKNSIDILPLLKFQTPFKFYHVSYNILLAKGSSSESCIAFSLLHVLFISFNLEQLLGEFDTFKDYRPIISWNIPPFVFVWYFSRVLSMLYIFGKNIIEVMLCSFYCILWGGTWFQFVPLRRIFILIRVISASLLPLFILFLFVINILLGAIQNYINIPKMFCLLIHSLTTMDSLFILIYRL